MDEAEVLFLNFLCPQAADSMMALYTVGVLRSILPQQWVFQATGVTFPRAFIHWTTNLLTQ